MIKSIDTYRSVCHPHGGFFQSHSVSIAIRRHLVTYIPILLPTRGEFITYFPPYSCWVSICCGTAPSGCASVSVIKPSKGYIDTSTVIYIWRCISHPTQNDPYKPKPKPKTLALAAGREIKLRSEVLHQYTQFWKELSKDGLAEPASLCRLYVIVSGIHPWPHRNKPMKFAEQLARGGVLPSPG